jgi:hypothetical protein
MSYYEDDAEFERETHVKDELKSVFGRWANNVVKQRRDKMPEKSTKVWKDDKGQYFHDGCFEDNETREWRLANGFTAVKSLDDLDEDEECGSCGGQFLAGLEPDEDDDVNDVDNDEVNDDDED